MRKLYFSFLLLFCAFSQLHAQNVNVTATAGAPNGSYPTLKDAFDAINSGTHQGAINVTIIASTVETATAQLQASGAGSSYTSVTIAPAGLVSISANITSTLINLNGATNVSINGGNSLTLSNPNTTGSVISFTNDASNNKIRKCNIQGNNTSTTSGVINFAPGTSTGSDGNLIDSCNITGNGVAARLIYSTGNTATSANQHSADTVRGCLLHDITGASSSPTFVFLSSGNTNWVIQDNSIYQTLPLTVTIQGITRGILAFPAWTSDAHKVIGNYIGGNSANAAGTLTINGSGSIAVGFIGLDIETGGPGNLIQRNLVQNISVSYGFTGGSFSNAGIFALIGGFSGESTIDRNKVSNLSYSNSTGSALAYGILCNGQVIADASTVEPSFFVTRDTVSNFTGNAGGTGNVQFYGIRFETSSDATPTANTAISNPLFYAYGNLITDMSTTYAGTNTILRGISNTNTLGAANPQLLPWFVIDSNEIRNITNPGTPASFTSPAVVGIFFNGLTNPTTTGDRQLFSRNHIHNLNATATSDVNNTATGIYLSNSKVNVYQNRIYDLKNKANGATNNPSIIGINARANFDTSFIFNNMISLGSGETSNVQVFGILNNFAAGNPMNTHFNSIYINGIGAGTNTKRSAAILRGTETFGTGVTTPMDIVNNILYNVRTGGTGNNYAIANTHTTPSTGWSTDTNDLYSTNPATVALWGAVDNDLATYKANSGDAGSKSFVVNFQDPTNGDLHLTGASVGDANLKGIKLEVLQMILMVRQEVTHPIWELMK
jgi:hypothetical protein